MTAAGIESKSESGNGTKVQSFNIFFSIFENIKNGKMKKKQRAVLFQ